MLAQIDAYAMTNTGLLRTGNEDNFYMDGIFVQEHEREFNLQVSASRDQNDFLFAVCDGMGGEASGEIASFLAVSSLGKYHQRMKELVHPEEKIGILNEYVRKTNNMIFHASGTHGVSTMGTTFAGLLISNAQACAIHLGDSRVYFWREDRLSKITTDHTEAERLVRLGVITREQAAQHRSRNRLSRHFGIAPEEGILEADISPWYPLCPGDLFLLCSDGLTDMVGDPTIRNILSETGDSKTKSHTLMSEALKNGGRDNITVIVIKVLGFS